VRLGPAWRSAPAILLGFWALDLAVAPEQRWYFLGLRIGAVLLAAVVVGRARAASAAQPFHRSLQVAALLMGSVVTTMTFTMGGFGALYTYFVPVALLGATVMFAWPVAEGATFLGLSLAYYVAGNGFLLARGTGTWAEALGGTLFVGALCTFSLLTMLFNERALRAELRLRSELTRANRALQASVQVLGEREGRLAAIGGVTHAIVHDVRNPLSAILSISLGVQEDARASGQVELAEDMEAVVGSGQRLKALFEQVQAFARAEGPPLDPVRVGLSSLVAACLADLARPLRSQGITLASRPGEVDGAEVLADRAAIRRVLDQLVRNAARAIAARRAAGDLVEGVIRVEASRTGRRAQLRVVDDGCGLDAALRARLFHPFSAAGPGAGHGLGLAVARSLVRAQGGELSVEPEPPPGGGAAFTVTLPLAPGD
jgi:signal transduction histidine kinase